MTRGSDGATIRGVTNEPFPSNDPETNVSELEALAHALARHARRSRVLGKTARRAPRAESSPARPLAPAGPRAAAPGLASHTTSGSPANARPAPRTAPLVPPPSSQPQRIPPLPPAAVASADSNMAKRTAKAPPSISPVQAESIAAAKSKAGGVTAAKTAEDVRAQARGAQSLDELRTHVAACEACGLCQTRTQTVFMDGAGARKVLFVGEAPGADEDRTGVPFVGRAGQLLTDIITKGMGIAREEVWIANVLKCRPPDNREPTTVEKETCTPWLDRQIELMQPEVIIPLGRHAAMHMLGIQAPMGEMRQKVHDVGGRKIVPTYHPAYLLRSPGEKKECWKDIQLAMRILKIVPPQGSKA
jgi:uracil-DNA glycosylase